MSWLEYDEHLRAQWLTQILPDSYFKPHFHLVPSSVVSLIFLYLPSQHKLFIFSRKPSKNYKDYAIQQYLRNRSQWLFPNSSLFSSTISLDSSNYYFSNPQNNTITATTTKNNNNTSNSNAIIHNTTVTNSHQDTDSTNNSTNSHVTSILRNRRLDRHSDGTVNRTNNNPSQLYPPKYLHIPTVGLIDQFNSNDEYSYLIEDGSCFSCLVDFIPVCLNYDQFWQETENVINGLPTEFRSFWSMKDWSEDDIKQLQIEWKEKCKKIVYDNKYLIALIKRDEHEYGEEINRLNRPYCYELKLFEFQSLEMKELHSKWIESNSDGFCTRYHSNFNQDLINDTRSQTLHIVVDDDYRAAGSKNINVKTIFFHEIYQLNKQHRFIVVLTGQIVMDKNKNKKGNYTNRNRNRNTSKNNRDEIMENTATAEKELDKRVLRTVTFVVFVSICANVRERNDRASWYGGIKYDLHLENNSGRYRRRGNWQTYFERILLPCHYVLVTNFKLTNLICEWIFTVSHNVNKSQKREEQEKEKKKEKESKIIDDDIDIDLGLNKKGHGNKKNIDDINNGNNDKLKLCDVEVKTKDNENDITTSEDGSINAGSINTGAICSCSYNERVELYWKNVCLTSKKLFQCIRNRIKTECENAQNLKLEKNEIKTKTAKQVTRKHNDDKKDKKENENVKIQNDGKESNKNTTKYCSYDADAKFLEYVNETGITMNDFITNVSSSSKNSNSKSNDRKRSIFIPFVSIDAKFNIDNFEQVEKIYKDTNNGIDILVGLTQTRVKKDLYSRDGTLGDDDNDRLKAGSKRSHRDRDSGDGRRRRSRFKSRSPSRSRSRSRSRSKKRDGRDKEKYRYRRERSKSRDRDYDDDHTRRSRRERNDDYDNRRSRCRSRSRSRSRYRSRNRDKSRDNRDRGRSKDRSRYHDQNDKSRHYDRDDRYDRRDRRDRSRSNYNRNDRSKHNSRYSRSRSNSRNRCREKLKLKGKNRNINGNINHNNNRYCFKHMRHQIVLNDVSQLQTDNINTTNVSQKNGFVFVTKDILNIGKFYGIISNDDTLYLIVRRNHGKKRGGGQKYSIMECNFKLNKKYKIFGLNIKHLQHFLLPKHTIVNKIKQYYIRDSGKFGFYIFYEYLKKYQFNRKDKSIPNRKQMEKYSYFHTGNGVCKYEWNRNSKCFVKIIDYCPIDGSDDSIDFYQQFARNNKRYQQRQTKMKGKFVQTDHNGGKYENLFGLMTGKGISRGLTYQNMQIIPKDWNENALKIFEFPQMARRVSTY